MVHRQLEIQSWSSWSCKLGEKKQPISRWSLRWNNALDHSCSLMDYICETVCPSGLEPEATGDPYRASYALFQGERKYICLVFYFTLFLDAYLFINYWTLVTVDLIAVNFQNSLVIKTPFHQVYLAVVLTGLRTARIAQNPCKGGVSVPQTDL